MKKASCILLAMMLIIAVFVSCKAEVIDDSDFLVNVMFSSENNSKGLTWSRDFAPENYYWSYDASKADNGPRTGTATKAKVGGDEGKGGLSHDVGPFSVGTWNFTLYGYTNAARTELVYEGHAQAFLAKGSSNPVKVNVSSKDEQTGTILVSKDIKLTDGTNTTYAPTHFSIKNAKDSSFAVDTNGKELKDLEFNTTGDMSYKVQSGSYVVTIEMRNEDGSVVYSSTQIYINVYDYQSTRIGGSLDDVKVATGFEAADGTIIGTSDETTVEASGSTTLIVKGVTPINSGDTTVEFPQGSLGSDASKVTLKVVAYPTSVAKGFSVKDGNGVPVVGIDLYVFIGDQSKEEFGDYVTVNTFVTKNLTTKMITSETAIDDREGFNLFYNGSDAEDKQPTLVSYNPGNGELIFKTNHFSLFYVTTSSTSVVAINETTGVAYTSLKAAVDAVKGSGYITLLKDTTGSEVISIEDEAKNITIDFNGKTYVVEKRSAFSFGKGNNVTLKNGTVQSNYQSQPYGSKFIENYCDLTLDSITLDCSGFRFPTYVLFCGYGKTLITGETNILNQKGKDNKYTVSPTSPAIKVLYNPSELYKEGVSVEFDENFTGKVGGLITLEKDKGTNLNGESYTHSLKVKGNGVFSAAEFSFPQVGARSVFEMNGNPTIYLNGNAQYPVKYDQNSNTATLSSNDFLVLNKTSDVKYEELGRAVNNSTDGQVLVLQKNITLQSAIANKFNIKSITIDLNGKTLGVNDLVSKAIITLQSGCLTIEDGIGSGILSKPIDSFFAFDGGELVINGGTFKSDPTSYVNPETHDISLDTNTGTWTVTAKN